MSVFGGYATVKVGAIPEKKLKRALDGQAIRLTNADLSGDRVMIVHPLNAKAIKDAQKKKKGLTTSFSHGEVIHDLKYHENSGAGVSGGSLWDWVKKGYSFIKDNWSDIKPYVSKGLDMAVAPVSALASQYGVNPAVVSGIRNGIKAVSGVGVGSQSKKARMIKGSPEAKDKMAKLRSMRGGSFRAAGVKNML